MNKFTAIIIASAILLLSSCTTTSNSNEGVSKEDRLEQNDIYIPWWAQENK